MKFQHVIFTLFMISGIALLTFTSPASAVQQTLTTTSVSTKAGQIIRNQVKQTIQTIKETSRSERADFHANRLERQFSMIESRLESIAKRIQSLIDKKKANGKDVSQAQAQLDSGKKMLAKAVLDGEKAVEMFGDITIDSWDVQKAEIKAAIDQAKLARREFIEAQKLMVQSVKLLRQL